MSKTFMKNLFTFLFALAFSIFTYAQTTVTGKVIDSDGQPIPSASVTIEEQGKDAIMAFSITNSKGEYKVTFTSAEGNVDLKIKAFNQKPLFKSISNQTQNLNFNMESDATEIKEVKIKTKLITKKGDTISYDLKAFESKADRTLADVLKKIPGIEVNPDGSVLYQGEPINKFYVNGKDLMEGGYGTVNNSLPKDAVSKVEVLENHQPVKILQDKVPSENAALNIKLKKSVTMTGRGEVGLGLDPLLWNVKLTPMFFGQKNQWVVNYKANNNGESVEKEGNLLSFGSRWEGRRGQAAQRNWIGIDEAINPSLPEKRYLFNNVHFFSANVLTSPFKSKEWELKLNASYTNNSVERESYRKQVYEPSNFFPDGLVSSENISNNFYTNSAKGEMIFTKNAKKGFFKNVTTWNGFWNEDRGLLTSQNSETGNYDLNESMSSPTGMFQNSLSTIIPWKEKLINFMSYLSYQKDRQTTTTFYNNFDDFDTTLGTNNLLRLDQNIMLKTLNVNHSASVGFSYKKFTFTPEIGLNMSLNDMNSQLFQEQSALGAKFQNDMNWNSLNPYTQVGINYKGQALNLNFNLPINFYGIDYKDNLRNEDREMSKTVFEPTFWGSYDFASFFKIWAVGSMNYSFGDFGDLYMGNLLASPRNIANNESLLPENRTLNGSTRLEYRNPLNNLFFNIRYGYNENKRNLIRQTKRFASGATLNNLITFDNSPTSQNQGVEIGKYFPKFKTNASVSFTNRDSNSFAMLVEENNLGQETTNINETKTNGQGFTFKFNNTYFSWLSLDYNLSMNWNHNKNLFYNTSNKTSGWNHNLATYVYPLKNHTVGFFWDDISTKQGTNNFRNSFYDISYQYTWEKKKIDFEIKWLNIANKIAYEMITYDPTYLSTSTSSLSIRPSQVMFTVKFNFK